MLMLRVVATGSSGNCYILSDDNKNLIIDAGVKMIEIKRAINYNLKSVSGCIISHEHL